MSVAAYLERAARLAAAAAHGVPIQRIIDLAMVDDFGDPVLAPGEGAEACRLLRMVRWEIVSFGDRAYLLKLLWHEPWWRARGNEWMASHAASFARSVLMERGLLVEQRKGRAA